MTLLTVVQDVCAAVGVDRPTSVFSNINYNRTMAEMLALANEMAQRIAYDTREWGAMKATAVFDRAAASDVVLPSGGTTPVQSNFSLPADFQRLLLTSNVRRNTKPTMPLRFIPDLDQWVQRRMSGYFSTYGEWHLADHAILAVAPPGPDLRTLSLWANNVTYAVGTKVNDGQDGTFWSSTILHVSAPVGAFATDRATRPTYWKQIFQEQIVFLYMHKNCIALASSGVGDRFMADGDSFRLDERLLKLGMTWQWRANKGSPYAEDLATYNDALDRIAGADGPAPIIIGRLPMSAAMNQSYPFPIDPGMVPL